MVQIDIRKMITETSFIEMFNFIILFLNDHRGEKFNSEQIIREYCKCIEVIISEYENALTYSEYSSPLKENKS